MLMLLGWVVRIADDGPEPEDVKAGWIAFVVVMVLIAVMVLLAFSFVKQLRKAQSAKDAGVYGDEPVERVDPEE
jgi:hypothetical protein